jgi:hypothetical protein
LKNIPYQQNIWQERKKFSNLIRIVVVIPHKILLLLSLTPGWKRNLKKNIFKDILDIYLLIIYLLPQSVSSEFSAINVIVIDEEYDHQK